MSRPSTPGGEAGPSDVGAAPSGDDAETTGQDVPWWRSEADRLHAGDPVALHLAARNGVATDSHRGRSPGTGDAADSADPVVDPTDPFGDSAPSAGRADSFTGSADPSAGRAAPSAGRADSFTGSTDSFTGRRLPGSSGDAGTAPSDPSGNPARASDPPGPGPDDHPGDCDVCPICRGLAHVRATHPELADHLVAAARHLTLAMREVVDTVASASPDRGGPATARGNPSRRAASRAGSAGGGFESIPLDDTEDES